MKMLEKSKSVLNSENGYIYRNIEHSIYQELNHCSSQSLLLMNLNIWYKIIIKNQNFKRYKKKKRKDESYTAKTGEHVPIDFAISVCPSPNVKCKKNVYFC